MKKSFMNKQLKNRYIIYLIMFSYCFGSFLGIFAHSSIASINGSYYEQNFTGLNGQGNISCNDNSINWLNIKAGKSPIGLNYPVVINDYYRIWQQQYAFFNFSHPTTEIKYNQITKAYGSASYASHETIIYDSLNNRMLRTFSNYLAGTTTFRVYGQTDATILFQVTNGFNASGNFKINLNGNSSIRLSSNGSIPFNVCYTPTHFDYTIKLRFYDDYGSGSTSESRTDNVLFLYGLNSPWEITSDYTLGSVLQTGSNYTSSLSTGSNFYILEKNPTIQLSGSNTIKQFALSVPIGCELSKMSILLHIDGVDYGYYDNSYYVSSSGLSSRYILTWNNLNHLCLNNNPKIEIVVTGTTLPCSFKYSVYTGDIDNDGIINFKWSSGLNTLVLPYFNGLYDGISQSLISEFQYKIWYNSSTSIINCGIDLSPYNNHGNFIYTSLFQGAHKYLEINYDVKSTLTIKGFQLLIGENTYNHGTQTTDYYLKVNGEPIGHSDCITKYGDNVYIITWNFTKLITNSNILFEVSSTYQLQLGLYNADIDGDGKKEVKSHNDYTLFDGLYNGQTTTYDVTYKFYYSSLILPNESLPYLDTIGTSKQNWKIGEDILFEYSALSPTPQNFIKCEHNGSSFELFGFPIKVNGQLGEFIFTPVYTGNYKMILYRNGNKASYNITVSHSSNDNIILFSYPNPSDVGTFYIYCKYFNINGNKGIITLNENNIFDLSTAIFQNYLNSNNTYNFSCSVSNVAISTYFLTLYEIDDYLGNITISQLIQKMHYIRSAYLENSITCIPKTGSANKDNPLKIVIRVIQQTFSPNIKVYRNQKLLFYNFGNIRDNTFYDNITSSGIYNYKLVLEISNNTIILDNDTVYVSEKIETGDNNVLSFIQPPYSYFVGVAIIILLTITPIIIGAFFHVDLNNIPQFLYMVFAIIGFIISILFGFFPSWTIAVLIIISVIILAIMWLQRKIA